MQQTLRISQGIWKGKPLRMPPGVKGNTHVTPGLVKEAVFQLLTARIANPADYTFFDLCAGSGQMGMEALSIGYGSVILCEIDNDRFRFLVEEIKRMKMKMGLHKRDFRRASSLMLREKRVVAFLDPPYTFWERSGECESIDRLLYNLVCGGSVDPLHPREDNKSGQATDESGDAESIILENLILIVQGPYPYNGNVPDESKCNTPRLYEHSREVRDYRGNRVTILELNDRKVVD